MWMKRGDFRHQHKIAGNGCTDCLVSQTTNATFSTGAWHAKFQFSRYLASAHRVDLHRCKRRSLIVQKPRNCFRKPINTQRNSTACIIRVRYRSCLRSRMLGGSVRSYLVYTKTRVSSSSNIKLLPCSNFLTFNNSIAFFSQFMLSSKTFSTS